MTTRDRPRFLSLALRCVAHQTYPAVDLVVVDDGDRSPVPLAAVESAGGRLVRTEPGTALGIKLNRGLEIARGEWCQKMDDDDWYGPDFLGAMVSSVLRSREQICRPAVAFLMPFLFFDLHRWEIRRSVNNNVPGATLFFARSDWAHRPFRALTNDEDLWFLQDQCDAGSSAMPVRAVETYLAVRHRPTHRDRGHTWVHQHDGRTLEQYLQERPLHKSPEELLPAWACEEYRRLREETAAA